MGVNLTGGCLGGVINGGNYFSKEVHYWFHRWRSFTGPSRPVNANYTLMCIMIFFARKTFWKIHIWLFGPCYKFADGTVLFSNKSIAGPAIMLEGQTEIPVVLGQIYAFYLAWPLNIFMNIVYFCKLLTKKRIP